jgi:ribosome-binding protein aMBF1 (putative translation factor)
VRHPHLMPPGLQDGILSAPTAPAASASVANISPLLRPDAFTSLAHTHTHTHTHTHARADERVNTELKKQITAARTAKKLTQAQLGQLINEKPQIIQDYESGKAIPNPQILSKLSRVLGVTLRKNAAPK